MVVPKAGTFTVAGSGSSEPVRMDATITGAQLLEGVHVLVSGTTEYINRGAAGAKAWGGRHWLRIDLSSQGAAEKAMADATNKSSGSQDPSTSVQLLTSSGEVERVGTERVDGVVTAHCFGVVDLKKLAGSDADLNTSADRVAEDGVTTGSVDMWINDQDLPVTFHVTAMTFQGAEDVAIPAPTGALRTPGTAEPLTRVQGVARTPTRSGVGEWAAAGVCSVEPEEPTCPGRCAAAHPDSTVGPAAVVPPETAACPTLPRPGPLAVRSVTEHRHDVVPADPPASP